MKKNIGLLLMSFLLLVGCNKNISETENKSINEDKPASETENKPINEDKPTSETENKSENKICDNVTFEQYLAHYNLTNDNVEWTGSSGNSDYYYLRYQGFVFMEDSYAIVYDDELIVCEKNFSKTDKLITLEELKSKYENMSSKELKYNLQNIAIFDVFKMFNLMTSTDEITSYIKRCNLSNAEINEQLNYVTSYYDNYVTSNSKYDKIVYTKEDIYYAISRAK